MSVLLPVSVSRTTLTALVAAREVRECLLSLNGLLTKAEGGSGGMIVRVEFIGGGNAETK